MKANPRASALASGIRLLKVFESEAMHGRLAPAISVSSSRSCRGNRCLLQRARRLAAEPLSPKNDWARDSDAARIGTLRMLPGRNARDRRRAPRQPVSTSGAVHDDAGRRIRISGEDRAQTAGAVHGSECSKKTARHPTNDVLAEFARRRARLPHAARRRSSVSRRKVQVAPDRQ